LGKKINEREEDDELDEQKPRIFWVILHFAINPIIIIL
jgi:hypothetical protein